MSSEEPTSEEPTSEESNIPGIGDSIYNGVKWLVIGITVVIIIIMIILFATGDTKSGTICAISLAIIWFVVALVKGYLFWQNKKNERMLTLKID